MSKNRKKRNYVEGQLHTCPTCGNAYYKDYCNNCGEKIFHRHDLSLAHILEEAVDKFTHLELKIPKSIALLFNPGYLTDKFVHGIRKPFAHPIQLFILSNVIFFLCYKIMPFTDFTPSWGDNQYYNVSNYRLFSWMSPVDEKINSAFDIKQGEKIEKAAQIIGFDLTKITVTDSVFQRKLDTAANPKILAFQQLIFGDTTHFKTDKKYKRQVFNAYSHQMTEESANYSKSLIFLLILLVAPIIYIFFGKKFIYAGSVLIFSIHFVSFYILYFGFDEVLRAKLYLSPTILTTKFYESTGVFFRQFIEVFFGGTFEFGSLIATIPYLFFSFKRLIQPKWWYNLIASYFIARIFFFICFGVYKKIILWIAISAY